VRPEAAGGNSHGLLEVHCGRLSHGRVLALVYVRWAS
jgi:hypothetical protein